MVVNAFLQEWLVPIRLDKHPWSVESALSIHRIQGHMALPPFFWLYSMQDLLQ